MKLTLFNLENFFLDVQTTPTTQLKPQEKLNEIVNIFHEIKADIYLLTEIGLCQSLNIFNETYLSNEYEVYCLPGNSDRGIEVGFLIKKSAFQKVEFRSNKSHPIDLSNDNIPEYFSRDLIELSFESSGVNYYLYLTHLKSKWDRENKDFEGRIKRRKEVEAIVQIIKAKMNSSKAGYHILAGDFNGLAHPTCGEDEFLPLFHELNCIDLLECLNLPMEERSTYYHFQKDQPGIGQQLDYFFLVNSQIPEIDRTNSGIYYFKDPKSKEKLIPKDHFERYALPSDHFPVILSIK